MITPSFDELLKEVDSKYSLVVVAAKRARQLMDGFSPRIEGPKSGKPVSVALHEIAAGQLRYERRKSGIK